MSIIVEMDLNYISSVCPSNRTSQCEEAREQCLARCRVWERNRHVSESEEVWERDAVRGRETVTLPKIKNNVATSYNYLGRSTLQLVRRKLLIEIWLAPAPH